MWSDMDLSQAWAPALLSTWANRPSWSNSGKGESIPPQLYLISKEERPLFVVVTSDVWCVAAVYPEEQSILPLLCPSYPPRNKLSLSTKKMYGLLSVLEWWSRGCQQEPLHEAVEAQRQFSALWVLEWLFLPLHTLCLKTAGTKGWGIVKTITLQRRNVSDVYRNVSDVYRELTVHKYGQLSFILSGMKTDHMDVSWTQIFSCIGLLS